MASAQQVNQEKFFESARSADLSVQTLAAIDRLMRLPTEEPGVLIEFNVNSVDHSMMVRVPAVSEDVSLFKVESDGSLELLIDLHRVERVKKALIWLAYRFGSDKPGLSNKKPRFKKGYWDSDIDAIIRVLKAFARGEEDVVAVAEGRPRAKKTAPGPVAPTQTPFEAPNPVASSSSPTQVTVPATTSFSAIASRSAPDAPTKNQLDDPAVDWNDPREREEYTRWVRSWQSNFRNALLFAYDRKCCVSDSGPETVLQAAHIDSHAESGDNSIRNGILLRADLHALFDAGLLRINPDSLEVVIDERAPAYSAFNGVQLRRPNDEQSSPDPERLRARWTKALEPKST